MSWTRTLLDRWSIGGVAIKSASGSTPTTSINSQVSQSSDDAEEAGTDATGSYSNGTMDLSRPSDLELIKDDDTSGGYSAGQQRSGFVLTH